jgi:hypothetical protein
MIGALRAGFAAGYGIAIPVGAVAVLIVETGIRSGFRAAAAAGAGAAPADGIYAAIAAIFGVSHHGCACPAMPPDAPSWDRACMLVDNAVPGESGTGRPRRPRRALVSPAAFFAGRVRPLGPGARPVAPSVLDARSRRATGRPTGRRVGLGQSDARTRPVPADRAGRSRPRGPQRRGRVRFVHRTQIDVVLVRRMHGFDVRGAFGSGSTGQAAPGRRRTPRPASPAAPPSGAGRVASRRPRRIAGRPRVRGSSRLRPLGRRGAGRTSPRPPARRGTAGSGEGRPPARNPPGARRGRMPRCPPGSGAPSG